MEDLDPEQWIVPNIVDRIAKSTPGRLYAEFPVSPLTYKEGYRGVSFQELSNAINCVANFLHSELGRGSSDFIPYIGPNDCRCFGSSAMDVICGRECSCGNDKRAS